MRVEGNSGGGGALTRHEAGSASGGLTVSNGKITLTNVTGKVVFAVVRYASTSSNDICSIASIYNDTIEYSTSRTGDFATNSGTIEQTGTTVTIPVASTSGQSSPAPRVIYYTA